MSLLAAVAIASCGCGSSTAAVAPSPPARVVFGRTVRVRFEGNKQLSDAALRSAVRIDKVDPTERSAPRIVLERDALLLTALYYDNGFLEVQIGPASVVEASDGPFVDVTFTIKKEGHRFRIAKLTAFERDDPSGPKILGDAELRKRIRSATGDWFNRGALVEDVHGIRTFYRDRGYANVDVSPETELRPTEGQVDLVIPVERGPIVRVETIVITGNTKTPLDRIKTELRLNEGELFSETRLEETKKHLEALFEKIEVTTEQGSSPDQMKITIEVVEK